MAVPQWQQDLLDQYYKGLITANDYSVLVQQHKIDAILGDIETKTHEAYEQAAKEMAAKVEKRLKKFDTLITCQKDLLDSGEITLHEYTAWLTRQSALNTDLISLSEVLAEDMHNTNLIAAKIAKDQMADVYAYSANYAMYDIGLKYSSYFKGQAGINFTLYNHETAEILLKEEQKSLLPAPSKKKLKELKQLQKTNPDELWNMQKMQSAMLQSVLQGEGSKEIAKRLTGVGKMNENQAIRNARTMTTNVQNMGHNRAYLNAKDMGIKLTIQWYAMLDGVTRHSHRQLHGVTKKNNKTAKFPNGCRWPGDPEGPAAEVYNCFVAETKIASDSKIVRSYKHWYEGPVVSIKTAGGIHFTCTPNHPIMTTQGWTAANLLNEGDNLLVTDGSNAEISRRNPDIDHVHPSMATIHNLLDELGGKRTRSLRVNFHGDIPTVEVEIVAHKGELRERNNPSSIKSGLELSLKSTDKTLPCKRTFMEHLRSVCFAALRSMRSFGKAATLFFGRMSHAEEHGIGSTTRSNAVFTENTQNNLTREAELFCEAFNRSAREILQDKIVSIEIKPFSGHVYNLQTETGYYFVNDSLTLNGEKCNGRFAIAHNCRCTTVAFTEGMEEDVPTDSKWLEQNNMTFDEWQKAKAPKSASPAGGTLASAPKADDRFSDARKAAAKRFYDVDDAHKEYLPIFEDQWDNLTEYEQYSAWEYTRNSNPINKSLSGYHDDWSRSSYLGPANTDWGHEDRWRHFDTTEFENKFGKNGHKDFHKAVTNLTNAIDKCELKEDAWFVRGGGNGGLAGLLADNQSLGLSYDDIYGILDRKDPQEFARLKKLVEGNTFQEHSFLSTGSAKGGGFSYKPVMYDVYAPAGTKAMYVEPTSYYGNTVGRREKLFKKGMRSTSSGYENETLFQRGTKYKINKLDLDPINGNIHVEMDAYMQPDYFKFGDEDTFNNGLTRHKK